MTPLARKTVERNGEFGRGGGVGGGFEGCVCGGALSLSLTKRASRMTKLADRAGSCLLLFVCWLVGWLFLLLLFLHVCFFCIVMFVFCLLLLLLFVFCMFVSFVLYCLSFVCCCCCCFVPGWSMEHGFLISDGLFVQDRLLRDSRLAKHSIKCYFV